MNEIKSFNSKVAFEPTSRLTHRVNLPNLEASTGPPLTDAPLRAPTRREACSRGKADARAPRCASALARAFSASKKPTTTLILSLILSTHSSLKEPIDISFQKLYISNR